MKNRFPRAVLIGAFIVTSAACSENPLAPAAVQTQAPASAARMETKPGHVTGACELKRRAPTSLTGWQASITEVDFPRSEAGPNGAMYPYRYRGYIADGELAVTADCLVPATEGAARRMDRLFDVERRVHRGGGFTTASVTSCGLKDQPPCPLDEFIGYACVGGSAWPDCNGTIQPEDIPQCSMFNECGSGTGWIPSPPPPGTPPPPDFVAPYNQGIMLWAACVLGMVGSGLSVWDVADEFTRWHAAYKDAESAQRIWRAGLENGVDPITNQMLENEYRRARQRQEDIAGEIASKTRVSYVTIGLAAAACGASILLPTP